mmetsp:Transcript_2530/g.4867  ORF Transcript_2530/g.4867 Transcript_2530/m.4867 type:complete len:257 (-) Transcript_2530:924-1694(-)
MIAFIRLGITHLAQCRKHLLKMVRLCRVHHINTAINGKLIKFLARQTQVLRGIQSTSIRFEQHAETQLFRHIGQITTNGTLALDKHTTFIILVDQLSRILATFRLEEIVIKTCIQPRINTFELVQRPFTRTLPQRQQLGITRFQFLQHFLLLRDIRFPDLNYIIELRVIFTQFRQRIANFCIRMKLVHQKNTIIFRNIITRIRRIFLFFIFLFFRFFLIFFLIFLYHCGHLFCGWFWRRFRRQFYAQLECAHNDTV